jgi:hypothetical protein
MAGVTTSCWRQESMIMPYMCNATSVDGVDVLVYDNESPLSSSRHRLLRKLTGERTGHNISHQCLHGER